MAYLATILNFFKGTYAKFGTSANLLREVTVSVLTAVSVAVLVQLLTPSAGSPVAEMRELLNLALTNQRQADSLTTLRVQWRLQGRIDSLTTLLKQRDEQDSLRANSRMSAVDAMRQINGAIHPAGTPARGR